MKSPWTVCCGGGRRGFGHRVRGLDCGVVKLKGVGGNEGQFLSRSDEHRFCPFTICFILYPNNGQMWFQKSVDGFG